MDLIILKKKLSKIIYKIGSHEKFQLERKNNSSIYACYSSGLIFRQIFEYLKTKKINKVLLGTIRFNFPEKKEYPKISLARTEGYEYLSFYWIQIANKYYRKLLNVDESDLVNVFSQFEVYLNARYLISLIEFAINSESKIKFDFYSPSTGNKIVDILFRRYYKKKYSLNIRIVYFSKIIKPSKEIAYFFQKIKMHKSPFTRIFMQNKVIYSKNQFNKVFIHHRLIKDREPENILFKKLSERNSFISLNFLSFLQIGSQNKIKFIYDFLKYIFEFFVRNNYVLIKYRLFLETIQFLSNYIYYKCCVNTINEFNIKEIIVTCIDFNYENILYKACRDNKAVSIFYDFSMGYPMTNSCIFRPWNETIRNPTYLVTCGSLRCNQYNYVNKFNYVKYKTISINSISPLIEYARYDKKNITFKNKIESKYYLGKNLKISIFDNLYGFNFHITEKDAVSCIDSIKSSPLEKIILCHNKKQSFLFDYLSQSELVYIPQKKANFSKVSFSDFIISIGFQGAALKAAFAFKKPLIFFTESPNFFGESNFFLEQKDNKKIITYLENLTFNYRLLSFALSDKESYEIFIKKARENSFKLLNAFELTDDLENASKVIENLI